MKWITIILADSNTELASVTEDTFIGRIIFITILGILECRGEWKCWSHDTEASLSGSILSSLLDILRFGHCYVFHNFQHFETSAWAFMTCSSIRNPIQTLASRFSETTSSSPKLDVIKLTTRLYLQSPDDQRITDTFYFLKSLSKLSWINVSW